MLTHVVNRQRARVHDTLQAHIEQRSGRLLEVAILVHVGGEVVGPGPETGIEKDVVDAAVLGFGLLEEVDELGPRGHVCLDKGVGSLGALGRRGWRDYVAVDDEGAVG